MADRPPPQQIQVHPQRYEGGYKGVPGPQRGGPPASKVLAVITGLPLGGGLLCLAGITLVGTLIGMAVATPLFILCSPILVPAALVIGFAVVSFLASGAFGLTGLTSLSWVLKCLREAGGAVPEQLDQAKMRMQDIAGFGVQKAKEVAQDPEMKAKEGK